ncbi:MAG TPA: hypothetical protein PL133_06355 [Methylophilaceae bacterium]|nr:hypothetical protein [Methylophilaceae bacterium]
MSRNLPFTAITDASGVGKTSVIKVRNIYPDTEGIPCNQKNRYHDTLARLCKVAVEYARLTY